VQLEEVVRRRTSSEGFLLLEITGDADRSIAGSFELREVLLLLDTIVSDGFPELREVPLLPPATLVSELREVLLLRATFSPDVLRSLLAVVEGEEKRLTDGLALRCVR
jgi:hypothetical protein